MRRTMTVAGVVAALTLVGQVALAISATDVVEKAKQERAKVDDYRSTVVTTSQRFDPTLGEDPMERTTVRTTWVFDGRKYRQDQTYEKRISFYGGKKIDERVLKSSDDIVAYDGTTTWMYDRQSQGAMYRKGSLLPSARQPRANHISLAEALDVGTVSEIAGTKDAKAEETKNADGAAVIVVEAPVKRRNRLERDFEMVKIEVLPEMGYLIQKAEFFDADGNRLSLYTAENVERDESGVYLTRSAKRTYFAPYQGEMYPFRRETAVLEEFVADPDVAEGTFKDIYPEGVTPVELTL